MAQDYLNDVFVSLHHNSLTLRWLDERFLPLFVPHLADELGRSETTVRAYVARQKMSAGMSWPDKLADNLARSKTLLALLSRPYRYSDWCRLEFSMMRARENSADLRHKTGNSLIVPVFIHDGEDEEYRDILDGTQPIDLVRPKMLCSTCMSPVGDDAKLLEDHIRAIAAGVARAIKVAPKYSNAWHDLACDDMLALFQRHGSNRAQRRVPGRE